MASILIHTADESVTLTAQAVKRLLDRGDGDAALLYLALLRHHGNVQPRSLAGELRWDKSRIEAAELVVVSRCVDIEVRAAYGKYDQLVRIASDCGAKVLDTVYDDAVTLRLRMLDGTQEPLLLKITELERGQERVRVSEPLEAAF